MEKIKKLVLLSTFLLFPEILNAFQDIINPDVTTNRWIIESNTKYLNKASARSFKGELEAEIVVDISEQRLYLVKNKKILSTGWTPKHSLKEGVEEIVRVFKEQRIKDPKDPIYSNEGFLKEERRKHSGDKFELW